MEKNSLPERDSKAKGNRGEGPLSAPGGPGCSARSFIRETAIVLLLLTGMVWCAGITVESSAQNLIKSDFEVGFSEQVFVGVNRTDAEAAFKAYMIGVGRRHGYDLTTRAQFYRDPIEYEAAIRGGRVQMAIIPAWDYLSMNIRDYADPYFVPVEDEGILQSYVLLAQQERGVKSFADLRGKSVAVLESMDAYLSRKWMETVLLEGKLGNPESFFSQVEKVSKPSGAVLPVFFGKYNACVVDRSAFNVMKELNPQIGVRLQAPLTSEPILSTVICLSKTGWISAKHKEDTRLGLAELGDTTEGQQILTLFRIRKLAPFKPEYLESIRRLRQIHDRLAPQSARNLPKK